MFVLAVCIAVVSCTAVAVITINLMSYLLPLSSLLPKCVVVVVVALILVALIVVGGDSG